MATAFLPLRTMGLAMLAMGIAAPSLAATTYSVTPLQNNATGYVSAYAIGATGAIVGQMVYGAVVNSPALWNNAGQFIDLAPGLTGNIGSYYAIGVDRTERVALYADTPYLWTNGTLTPIDLGPAGGSMVTMNDVGQILIDTGSGATVWTNGIVTSGGAGIIPSDLNNNGDVAGRRNPTGTAWQAAFWSNGTFTDLGVLPGDTSSSAYAINDTKHVVGASYLSSSQIRPFFWKDGVMAELGGVTGSTRVTAKYVNNSDQVVGNAYIGTNTIIPLRWDNGVVTNLSAVIGQRGDQCDVEGINDAGQIAACGYRLTPVASGADIGVAIKPSATSVVVGDTLTYNVIVTNAGAEPVTNAMLTDTLPVGVSFVSSVPSQGICNGSTTLMCALGDLAPGASANVQLAVTSTMVGTLVNSASVTVNEADVNAVNDNASVNVAVTQVTADIGVTVTDSPDPVKRRSNLTYAIVVKNSGPGSASGVVVTDTIPSSMSFVSARSTQGSCSGMATVTCNLGNVANGVSGTVAIVVQPRFRGTYSNTASVTSTTSDTNAINNSATVTTQVQ